MSYPPYPKYKESGVAWVAQVPSSWTSMRMRFLIRPGIDGMRIGPFGSALTSDTLDAEGPFRVYGQENIIGRNFETGTRRISAAKFKDLAAYEITAGDLLVTMMGTSGRCYIVPEGTERGIMDSHLLRLRLSASSNPSFVRWLVDEAAYVGHQFRLAGKGSIMHGLNSAIVRDLTLLLPPPEEQAAIVRFLDRETAKIDALVAEQERLIELLKEKRQAVISHAVTKGLNPAAPMKDSGIGWLGPIPAHWPMTRLRHISPFVTVGVVVNPSEYVTDEGLPFIYGGDIREGVIDWANARRIDKVDSDANAKTRIEAGDLLTVRVGAPGVTAVVPKECAGGNCASVMLVRRGDFNSDWLCLAMNARVVRYQVEVVQYGAAQEQFNISHALNFWIPTPPRVEQDAIVAAVSVDLRQIDELISSAARGIELLSERRAALISAAVTGQIDVRDVGGRPVA